MSSPLDRLDVWLTQLERVLTDCNRTVQDAHVHLQNLNVLALRQAERELLRGEADDTSLPRWRRRRAQARLWKLG